MPEIPQDMQKKPNPSNLMVLKVLCPISCALSTGLNVRKRYRLIFAISLLVANAYAFWPVLAYSNTMMGCPAIFGTLSYSVSGAAEVLGPPLFSEMQVRMTPGTTAYETETYTSQDNLTQMFQRENFAGYSQAFWTVNPFDGVYDSVFGNSTGVSIMFQNITYNGIHVANLAFKISISSSASSASYEIGGAPCWPGLILTVGSFPYTGPLAYGRIQAIGIIVNNAIALVVATIICFVLRFYWNSKMSSPQKSVLKEESRPTM